MKVEDRTTSRRVQSSNPPPDPVRPEGAGWELRGGNATPNEHGITTYAWYWTRRVSDDESNSQGDSSSGEYLTQVEQ